MLPLVSLYHFGEGQRTTDFVDSDPKQFEKGKESSAQCAEAKGILNKIQEPSKRPKQDERRFKLVKNIATEVGKFQLK